ncbi:MAG: hypothetical protein ACO1OB_22655, partial [Archangium sp.]
MGYRAWVCLAALALAACGGTPTPDGGSGGGTDGGETGGGAGDGGGGSTVANDTCQTAEVIAAAGTYTGTTIGAKRDYATECTGYPNDAEDVVYALKVPAGSRVTVGVSWLNVDGPSFDPSLYVLGTCDAAADAGVACLAGADESEDGQETLEWLNDSTAERTVFLVVDSYRARAAAGADGGVGKGTSGEFLLEVNFATPRAGDSCASAVELTPGTALTAQAMAGFTGDYLGSMTCANGAGADRAYKVTVPAGHVATVAVQGSGGLDSMVSAATSAANCGVTCVA